MSFEKSNCMCSLSVCQKESRHDTNCAEFFISEVDLQKLNILGST